MDAEEGHSGGGLRSCRECDAEEHVPRATIFACPSSVCALLRFNIDSRASLSKSGDPVRPPV